MQSGQQGRLPSSSFVSISKLRLREPVRKARDAIKTLETNVSASDLTTAVDRCTESINVIKDIVIEDLNISEASGFIKLLIELIHRVVDIVRIPENIKDLGPGLVVETIDKFLVLVEDILSKIGSYDAALSWVQEYELEEFQDALPASTCFHRKKLSLHEINAHSRLFIEKGDILRYRNNINKESYNEAAKAYWYAFTFTPEFGMIFNQLGVISLSTDPTDRLAYLFFFMRAIYAKTSFEKVKEILLSQLGSISNKMIESNFTKYSEIFKMLSITDLTGISAANITPTTPDEYYFSWFVPVRFPRAKWEAALSKLDHSVVRKIMHENFLHVINFLLHKLSHPTLHPCCERFLALANFMLEEKAISRKELLQLTYMFILAIKSRENLQGSIEKNDETFKTAASTFVQFIGLLLSNVTDILSKINDGGAVEEIESPVLPSLVVIASCWDSLVKILPSDIYLSNSYIFDFAVIRKRIKLLGKELTEYLKQANCVVEYSKDEKQSEGYIVLPEVIYSCWGSQFAANMNSIKLKTEQSTSAATSTLLIRLSLIHEWMIKLINEGYFRLTKNFENRIGANDVSTFEIYALSKSSSKDQKIFAIYPEFVVIDTNAFIDEVKNVSKFGEHGIKVAVPSVVLSELTAISKEQRKDEATRSKAAEALKLISSTILGTSANFQVFNYYGERKFDLEITPRDIAGLNNKSKREKARDTNDDFILTICRNLEEVLEPSTHKYGHIDSKITVRKVVLITSDKILRIKARSDAIPTCGFEEFFTWFNKCITSSK